MERVIVTLIHGTHARKAPWTQKGSNLREAVVKAFYPSSVQFEPFDWSGGNTIEARRAAAEKLRTQIVAGQVPASDTRHFVIAHSHGGNIALYALRDPAVRERITGVATLAAPFLIARERNLGSIGLVLFSFGFVGWGWLAGALIRYSLWPSADYLPVFLAVGFVLLAINLGVRLEWGAGKVANDMQLASPAHGRLWIARMCGDEATAGLQTGHFATTIVAQIQLLFGRAHERAERMSAISWRTSVWRVAGGVAIAAVAWALGKLLGIDDKSAPVLGSYMFLIAVTIALVIILWGLSPHVLRAVLPFAEMLVVPLALALAIALVVPLGPSLAYYSFLLEMSAEATPLGTWTVSQYEPVLNASVSREAAPTLTHSWVYDQRNVLDDLTTWMKQCTAHATVEPTPRSSS